MEQEKDKQKISDIFFGKADKVLENIRLYFRSKKLAKIIGAEREAVENARKRLASLYGGPPASQARTLRAGETGVIGESGPRSTPTLRRGLRGKEIGEKGEIGVNGEIEKKAEAKEAEETKEENLVFVPLAQIAKSSSYSKNYINYSARQGKLRAKKIGGVWHTTEEWLAEFTRVSQTKKNEFKEKLSHDLGGNKKFVETEVSEMPRSTPTLRRGLRGKEIWGIRAIREISNATKKFFAEKRNGVKRWFAELGEMEGAREIAKLRKAKLTDFWKLDFAKPAAALIALIMLMAVGNITKADLGYWEDWGKKEIYLGFNDSVDAVAKVALIANDGAGKSVAKLKVGRETFVRIAGDVLRQEKIKEFEKNSGLALRGDQGNKGDLVDQNLGGAVLGEETGTGNLGDRGNEGNRGGRVLAATTGAGQTNIGDIEVSAYLMDASNKEIPNGEYDVRFGIYTTDRAEADPYPSDADKGARVWEETQKVTVENGLLRTYLGATTPIPASFNFAANNYWIGVRVGEDAEMVPRKRIGAVPLARTAMTISGQTIGNGAGNIPLSNGTLSTNLNADLLDGQHASAFQPAGSYLTSAPAEYLPWKLQSSASDAGQKIKSGKGAIFTGSNGIATSRNLSTLTIALDATSSPTLTGLTLSGLTPYGVIYGNGTGALQSVVAGTEGQVLTYHVGSAPTWDATPPAGGQYVLMSLDAAIPNGRVLTGTANQVIITDGGAGGAVTLSLPQSIDVTDSPTFATLNLTTLDLGVNTIADGNFTGNWNFNGGNLSGVGTIGSGNITGGTYNGNTITAGAGTLTLNANTLALTGNSQINQNLLTTSAPSFTGLTVSGLLANGPVYTTAGGVLNSEQYLDVTRGGTGVGTFAQYGVLYGNNANDILVTAAGTNGQIFTAHTGAAPTWENTAPAAPHEILSAQHSDTTSAAVQRGDLMTGQGAAPTTWSRLAKGGANTFLYSDGTDLSWLGITLGTNTTGNYVATLAGTADQVLVSAATGNVTLSLPQSINTTSSPTFATLNLTTLDLGTNTISDGNFNGGWSFNAGTLTNINALTATTGNLTTLDLGTNTITDGNLNGDWNFNAGNLTNITALTTGTANVTTLDLGTNTITDGNMNGSWNFNAGALTNIASIDTITTSGTALTFTSTAPTISVSTAATAINLDAGTTGDVNIAGTSTGSINFSGGSGGGSGCTIDNAGNLTCSGDIGGGGTGSVGYWTRTGTVLSPKTVGDTVAVYANDTNTSGTLFSVSYTNLAPFVLNGALIGAKIDLNDGHVTPTNQDVTGVRVVLPTTTNTNDVGTTITYNGMSLGYGVGTGINQNGAGATVYNGANLLMPALTQTLGSLTANGALITTSSSISTGGTANAINIAATGVGFGSLNGVYISAITGSGGTERAISVGSGWDAVLTVNGNTVINGSGVVPATAGGTGLTSYAAGDIIYADTTTTFTNLASGAGNNGKVLVVSGGVPTWGVMAGSSCTDCVLNDPTSVTTQTIQPPSGANISSLVIREAVDGVTGSNIFEVGPAGAPYFYVDENGNVSTGGTASQTLTLTPASNTTALTLVGTNVTTAALQYINAKNTQGTIFNMAYGAVQTLGGALIGAKIDLSTNVTATNQSATGISVVLPTPTNSSGTVNYKGLTITNTVGGGLNQETAGTTVFSGVDVTIPPLTQTAGSLTANGVLVNTPATITTAGTANGISIAATGIGAGSLYGLNVSNLAGGAGAGAETAIHTGTGWDYAAIFEAGNVGIGDATPASLLSVGNGDLFQVNSSGNIVKLNNVTTTFPASQGALGSVLTNSDGAGTLTWASPSGSGIIGYWSRTGTTLSPATAGDDIVLPTGDWIGLDAAKARLVFTDTARDNLTITDGDLLFSADNTWDIGATGATRARTIYAGTSVIIGSAATLTADTFTGSGALNLTSQLAAGGGIASAFNITSSNDLGVADELLQIGDSAGTFLTILGSGNVGIGTTNPGSLLHLSTADATSALTITDTTNSKYLTIGHGDNYSIINSDSGTTGLWFNFGGVTSVETKMAITSGGNVGIGTTTPGARLEVDQSGTVTTANYGASIYNTAISSTDSINKYGLYVSSTGTWNGIGATNYGLYVAAPTGGTANTTAFFGGSLGNVSIDGNGATLGFSRGAANYIEASNVAGSLGFQTGGANTRMTIDAANGNVGIGTAAPEGKLQVQGGSVYFATSDWNTTVDAGGALAVTAATNYTALNQQKVGDTLWGDIALANAGGNVGIGTLIPGFKLDVNGIVNATALYVGGAPYIGSQWTTAAPDIYYNTGNVGIGDATPNHLLDVEGNIGLVAGGYINWDDTDGTTGYGFRSNSGTLQLKNSGGAWTNIPTSGTSQWSSTGSDIYFNTGNVGIGTNTPGAARLTVMSGNVGIGTTSPNQWLHIYQSAPAMKLSPSAYGATDYASYFGAASNAVGTLQFGNNGQNYIVFGNTLAGGYGDFYVNNSNAFPTAPNGTLAMRLTASGNVGIGTTTAAGKLQVNDAYPSKKNIYVFDTTPGGGSGGGITFGSASIADGASVFMNAVDATNSQLKIQTKRAGTLTDAVMIDQSGNVGIGTVSPAQALHVIGSVRISTLASAGNQCVRADSNGVLTGTGADCGAGGTSNYWTASGSDIYNNNAGNVGIGTAAPGTPLAVLKTGATISGNFLATGKFGDAGATKGIYLGYDSTSVTGIIAPISTDNNLAFWTHSTATGSTEKMRITGGGNVGIGTTAPGSLLQIQTDQNAQTALRVVNATAGTAAYSSIQLRQDAAAASFGILAQISESYTTSGRYIAGSTLLEGQGTGGLTLNALNAAGVIRFYTNNTEYMRLTSTGNVGIGTTTPGAKLSVSDSGAAVRYPLFLLNTQAVADNNGVGIDFRVMDSGAIADYGFLTVYADDSNAASRDSRFAFSGWAAGVWGDWLTLKSGNVGIGTTTPGGKLEIIGAASNQALRVIKDGAYNSETNFGLVVQDPTADTGVFLGADATNHIGVLQSADPGTSWTTRNLAINPNGGNVGIGTTTPTSRLYIKNGAGGGSAPVGAVDSLTIENGDTAYINIITPTNKGGGILFSDDSRAQGIIAYNHAAGYGPADSMSFIAGGSSSYMTILASGNVGIGTTTPGYNLDVRTAAATFGLTSTTGTNAVYAQMINTSGLLTIGVENSAGGALATGSAAYAAVLVNSQARSLHLGTSGAARMTIDSGGNVGIGTTTPGGKLEVAGQVRSMNVAPSYGAGAFYAYYPGDLVGYTLNSSSRAWDLVSIVSSNPDRFVIRDSTAGAERLVIDENGNVGIGTNSPSQNLQVTGNVRITGLSSAGNQCVRADANGVLTGTGADCGGGGTSNYWTASGSDIYNNNAGNVGIGTATPGAPLDVYKSQNARTSILLTNDNAGTGAHASLAIRNGTGANEVDALRLVVLGTAYTTDGGFVQDSGLIDADANLSGGLSIMTRHASAPIRFYTGGYTNERMRITEGGNVGIGTTTPASILDVVGPVTSTAKFTTSSTDTTPTSLSGALLSLKNSSATDNNYVGIMFRDSNDYAVSAIEGQTVSHTNHGGGLLFITRPASGALTERLRIDSGGNVGIGDTTPDHMLDVAGNIGLNSGSYINFSDTDGSGGYGFRDLAGVMQVKDSGGSWVNIPTSSTTQWTNNAGSDIYFNTGNVGIGTTTPLAILQVKGPASAGWNALFTTSDYAAGVGSVLGFDFGATSGNTYSRISALSTGQNAWNNLVLQSGGGSVGIGTTTPTLGKLQVNQASDAVDKGITVTNAAVNQAIYTWVNGTTGRIDVSSNGSGNLAINGGGTGNVGIGTTTPGQKLEVNGNAQIDGDYPWLALKSTTWNATTYMQNNLTAGGAATGDYTGFLNPVGKGFFFYNSSVATMMTIGPGGNVGIGTTTPGQLLDVRGSNPRIRLQDTGTGITAMQFDGGSGTTNYLATDGAGGGSFSASPYAFNMYVSGAYPIVLHTNAAERMRITSGGNVGIGTTTPGAKLEVNGGIKITAASGGVLTFADGTTMSTAAGTGTGMTSTTDLTFAADSDANGSGAVFFSTAGTNKMTIINSGNVGIGTATPNEKFVVDVSDASGGPGVKITNPSTGYAYQDFTNSTGLLRIGKENGAAGALLTGDIANAGILATNGAYPLQLGTNNAPRMTIGSGGNVGIGTTSPGYKLDVQGSGGALQAWTATTGASQVYTVYTNTGGNFNIGRESSVGGTLTVGGLAYASVISDGSANALQFGTNNTARMIILADGNVGIGTTTPLSKLHVSSANTSTAGVIGASDSAGASGYFTYLWSGWSGGTPSVPAMVWTASSDFRFGTGTTNFLGTGFSEKMRITTGGNVGIGTTSPIAPLQVSSAGNTIIAADNTTAASTSNYVSYTSYLQSSTIRRTASQIITEFTDTTDATRNGRMRFNLPVNGTLTDTMALTGGNVGIGTTTPTHTLDVRSAIAATAYTGNLAVYDTTAQAAGQGGGIIFGGAYTDAGALGEYGRIKLAKENSTSGNQSFGLGFWTRTDGGNIAEQLRIDSNGNVGIGTTTPVYKLEVAGTAYFGGALTIVGNILPSTDDNYTLGDNTHRWSDIFLGGTTLHIGASTADEYAIEYNNTSNKLGFNVNGSGDAEITFDGGGNVGIGTTTPTSRIHGVTSLTAATGNEIAYQLNYTTNKATSGNDTGLLINMTDTASPGVSSLIDLQKNGDSRFRVAEDATAYWGVGSAYGKLSWDTGRAIVQGQSGMDLSFGANAAVDQLYIKSGGNVGIGTTTPGSALHIYRSASTSFLADALTVSRPGVPGSYSFVSYIPSSDTGVIGAVYSGGAKAQLALRVSDGTNNTDAIWINNVGNVGIGTQSPEAKLHLYANSASLYELLRLDNLSSGSGTKVGFYQGATEVGRITNDFNTNSSWQMRLGTYGALDAVTINTSGYVGIGTTNPGALLQVYGSAMVGGPSAALNSVLDVYANSSGYFRTVRTETSPYSWNYYLKLIPQASSGGYAGWSFITNDYSSPGDGSITTMTLKAGSVGIGTTTPQAKLQIAGGGIYLDNNQYLSGYNTFSNIRKVIGFNSSNKVQIGGDTDDIVMPNGNVGIGTTTVHEPLSLVHDGYDEGVTNVLFTGEFVKGDRTKGLYIGYKTDETAAVIAPGNTSGILAFYNHNGTSWGERMRISATGNVGIGTSTPAAKLVVNGTTEIKDTLSLFSASSSWLIMGSAGTAGNYGYLSWDDTNKAISMVGTQGNAASMTWKNGNVGIGTTTPAAKLQMVDSAATWSEHIINSNANAYGLAIQCTGNSAADHQALYTSNGASNITFSVYNDGSGYLKAAAWTYGSDRRMKENIAYLGSGLDKIMALKPASFDYIQGPKNNLGFIAQDVQQVIPEAVAVADPKTGMLGLKTDFIVPYLVAGMQQQQGEISDQGSQISSVKLQITDQSRNVNELQTAVNDKLNLVSNSLTALGSRATQNESDIVSMKTRLTSAETKLQTDENNLASFQTSMNDTLAAMLETENLLTQRITDHETRLAAVEAKISAMTIVAGDIPSNVVTADTSGNVDLTGILTAKGVVAGSIDTKKIKLGDQTSGKDTLAAGKTEKVISTTEASADAKIYVTPLGKLSGRSLFVDMSKVKAGESFTVELDGESLTGGLDFNWLVVK